MCSFLSLQHCQHATVWVLNALTLSISILHSLMKTGSAISYSSTSAKQQCPVFPNTVRLCSFSSTFFSILMLTHGLSLHAPQ